MSFTGELEAHIEYIGILIAESWSFLSTEQVTHCHAELWGIFFAAPNGPKMTRDDWVSCECKGKGRELIPPLLLRSTGSGGYWLVSVTSKCLTQNSPR